MKPLDLEEFAEELRRNANRAGDHRAQEFAVEILALMELEKIHESELERLNGEAETNEVLITSIEEKLGHPDNPLDEIDGLLEARDILAAAEEALKAHGWNKGDFLEALQELVECAPPATGLTYDL